MQKDEAAACEPKPWMVEVARNIESSLASE
jgi:hypothetical protein